MFKYGLFLLIGFAGIVRAQEIPLQSADGQEIRVPVAIAQLSGTVRHLIEEVGTEAPIPLPNIQGNTLKIVIQGLEKVSKLQSIAQKLQLKPKQGGTDHYVFAEVKEALEPTVKGQALGNKIELLLTANYLDVPALTNGYAYVIAQDLVNDPAFFNHLVVGHIAELIKLLRVPDHSVLSAKFNPSIAAQELYNDQQLKDYLTPITVDSVLDNVEQSKDALESYLHGLHYQVPKELVGYIFKHVALIQRGLIELSVADYLTIHGAVLPMADAVLPLAFFKFAVLSNKGITSLYGTQFIANSRDISGLFLDANSILGSDVDTDFPEHPFEYFVNVRVLALSNNLITRLPIKIFLGLEKLERLYLQHNQFTALPLGVFADLDQLSKLDLSVNKFQKFPKAITSLNNLTELNLSDNELDHVQSGDLEKMSNLITLNLSHNNLQTLPKDVFKGLVRLENLYLRGDTLSDLPIGIFDPLVNLRKLYGVSAHEREEFARKHTLDSRVLEF